MKIKAIYDNGGQTFDRYSVFTFKKENGMNVFLGLSHNPNSPQGFSQFGFGTEDPNPLLGKKIELADLTEEIQNHIVKRLKKQKEI